MSQKQRLKRLESKTHGQLIAFFALPRGLDNRKQSHEKYPFSLMEYYLSCAYILEEHVFLILKTTDTNFMKYCLLLRSIS